MAAWLRSRGHRANIQNPSWRAIGVGVAVGAGADVYWVQNFGSYAGSAAPLAAPARASRARARGASRRDRTPPSPPRVEGPRRTSDDSPTYRFSARDRGTRPAKLRYRCSFDSPRLRPCAARHTERLAPGEHVLRVRAVDRAGNASAITQVVVVVTPPAPPAPPPPAAVTSGPSSVTVQTGALRSGDVTSVAQDDDRFLEVDSAVSHYSASATSWFAVFAGVPESVQTLVVTYRGSSSADCDQTLSLWDWTNRRWVVLASGIVGATEVELRARATDRLPDYVSDVAGPGQVAVEVRCSRSGHAPFSTRADLLTISYT